MKNSYSTRYRRGVWGEHHRGTSAVARTIGPAPHCDPDDRDTADRYLRTIEGALEQRHWTPNERSRLCALRRKWEARVHGHDLRFIMFGTRRGALPEHYQQMARQMRLQPLPLPSLRPDMPVSPLQSTKYQRVREWLDAIEKEIADAGGVMEWKVGGGAASPGHAAGNARRMRG